MAPALWVVRKKSQTMPSQQQTLPDGAGAVSKIVLVSRLKPPIPQYLVWWGRDVTGCMVGRWGWEGPPCFWLWHGCFALLVSAICERLESVFLSLSGGPVTLPINLDTCPLSIITGTSEFCHPPPPCPSGSQTRLPATTLAAKAVCSCMLGPWYVSWFMGTEGSQEHKSSPCSPI